MYASLQKILELFALTLFYHTAENGYLQLTKFLQSACEALTN